MTIGNARSVGAGALFLAFGGFVLLSARTYPMGTATEMGPGYFPTLLAGLLCALGVLAIVQGVRSPTTPPIGAWPWRQGGFVIVGVLGFAALIDTHGLVPAVIVLVACGCYDRLLRRPLEVAIITLLLLALTYVVFIYAIELPIDFW